MEKKKTPLADAVKNALSQPSPPMNLPSEYEYKRGPRGGAILVDKVTKAERYATDEEKKEYNLPKPRAFHKREYKNKS